MFLSYNHTCVPLSTMQFLWHLPLKHTAVIIRPGNIPPSLWVCVAAADGKNGGIQRKRRARGEIKQFNELVNRTCYLRKELCSSEPSYWRHYSVNCTQHLTFKVVSVIWLNIARCYFYFHEKCQSLALIRIGFIFRWGSLSHFTDDNCGPLEVAVKLKHTFLSETKSLCLWKTSLTPTERQADSGLALSSVLCLLDWSGCTDWTRWDSFRLKSLLSVRWALTGLCDDGFHVYRLTSDCNSIARESTLTWLHTRVHSGLVHEWNTESGRWHECVYFYFEQTRVSMSRARFINHMRVLRRFCASVVLKHLRDFVKAHSFLHHLRRLQSAPAFYSLNVFCRLHACSVLTLQPVFMKCTCDL